MADMNHPGDYKEKDVFAVSQNVAYSPTQSDHEYETIPI